MAAGPSRARIRAVPCRPRSRPSACSSTSFATAAPTGTPSAGCRVSSTRRSTRPAGPRRGRSPRSSPRSISARSTAARACARARPWRSRSRAAGSPSTTATSCARSVSASGRGGSGGEIEREAPEDVARFHGEDTDFAVEGAESRAELQRRGVAAIERIVAEAAAERVLVVSHGALLRAALCHYAALPLTGPDTLPPLGNCSLSLLEADGPSRRVALPATDDD